MIPQTNGGEEINGAVANIKEVDRAKANIEEEDEFEKVLQELEPMRNADPTSEKATNNPDSITGHLEMITPDPKRKRESSRVKLAAQFNPKTTETNNKSNELKEA